MSFFWMIFALWGLRQSIVHNRCPPYFFRPEWLWKRKFTKRWTFVVLTQINSRKDGRINWEVRGLAFTLFRRIVKQEDGGGDIQPGCFCWRLIFLSRIQKVVVIIIIPFLEQILLLQWGFSDRGSSILTPPLFFTLACCKFLWTEGPPTVKRELNLYTYEPTDRHLVLVYCSMIIRSVLEYGSHARARLT